MLMDKLKNNSIFVEFSGFSGVGKSTLSMAVYQNLNELNIKCDNINYLDLPVKSKINLKIFFYTLRLCLNLKPSLIKPGRNLCRRLYASFIKINHYRSIPGIHLSDQGVFNTIGTIRKYGSLFSIVEIWKGNLLPSFLLPDFLVICRASSETISTRRYERDGVAIDISSIVEGQNRSLQLEEEVKFIGDHNEKFNYLVVYNEQNNSLKKNADNVINCINEKFHYI